MTIVCITVTDIKESISDPTKLFWLSGITGNSLNCSQKETVKFGSSITASFENVRIQPFDVKGDKFSDKGTTIYGRFLSTLN